MMRILLHSHFPPGHAYPMQAIASTLISRGHTVTWLTSTSNASLVTATGATFFPTDAIALLDAPLIETNCTGLLDGNLHKGRVLAQVHDYKALMARGEVDIVLVDVLTQGVQALWEMEGIVWASLGVIPMYTSNAGAPFGVSGGRPSVTVLGKFWSWVRHLVQRLYVLPRTTGRVINEQRKELGLRAVPFGVPMERFLYSPFLHIQASSSRLEFDMLPKGVAETVFVGPLVLQQDAGVDVLADWRDRIASSKKVIGITQGTLATDPTSLIIPSIQALSPDEDNLFIVISPFTETIRSKLHLPTNVILLKWIPYYELLPILDLLITNGGYGSITQALSYGVPILCAGQSEDKKDTAARVEWCGVGLDLGTDMPSVEMVREAVGRILGDGRFNNRTEEMEREMMSLGGAEAACDALERLAGGVDRYV